MKFKVGDKVERTDGNNYDFKEGETGIIVAIGTSKDSFDVVIDATKKNSPNNFCEYLKLISNLNYKPKDPTHVVIWEEDSDPAKLFTSEDEAKDFIKELSEKSNVNQDSILFLEVKSCKKVKVSKSLRYANHKI